MKRNELFFLITVIVCLLAVAVYTIGGALQDIDYHGLSDKPLAEQQEGYERLQKRKKAGEKMQLFSAIVLLVCFLGIMLLALTVGTATAEKQSKKAEQAMLRQ